MQEVCLRLMGKKLLVALAMEGKFASEGLQAIDGDDDLLTAMARELVQNRGIGESADSVWRRLGALRPTTLHSVEPQSASSNENAGKSAMTDTLPDSSNAARAEAIISRTRLSRGARTGQLSLF